MIQNNRQYRNLDKIKTVAPNLGYDAVAGTYDTWIWSAFWNANETPMVQDTITQMQEGYVLDAGCGTGRYRPMIEQSGHHYIGVDVSGSMLEINRSRWHDSTSDRRAPLCLSDLRECPVGNATMEGLVCTRTLSHLDDLRSGLLEFYRILRPGGVCLITDIHAEHPYHATSIPGTEGKVAIETYKWTQSDLREAADYAGFDVVRYQDICTDQLLSKPAHQEFMKLYKQPEIKIFYILVLRRRDRDEKQSLACSDWTLRHSDIVKPCVP